MPIDFKKTEKELYFPKTTPSVIDVPQMTFITIDGEGNPNTSLVYQGAVEALYGLSYTIKMSKTGAFRPDGFFDYVVPPLEGLWMLGEKLDIADKDAFVWTMMIRQPDFVTSDVFEGAKATLAKKKPELDLSKLRLQKLTEGLCAQIMHIGPYDDEPATIAKLKAFVLLEGFIFDLSDTRHHHEIYLSDPRKTAPEKMKTALRYPIRRA